MQKRKIVALAGVTLLSVAFLAACGNGGAAKKSEGTTYSYVYTEDPTSLDYIVNNKQQVSQHTTNFVDGLLENDKYGNLVPSLAEDWKVSKDGLTYTYTLREGVKWYTADGEEYADVTAEDFVTSIKHAVAKKSEGLYIIQNSIKGLDDYVTGKTTDFETVGVKALDERTVQYTLEKPESYWNSKLTMTVMMPLNAEFLESKGDDFGAPNPDGILYNGPYFLTNMTAKSVVEYQKNPEYWDAENVKIDNVKLTFFDGSDPEALVNGFIDGNYTNARVFPNTSSFSSVKKKYGENITYSMQDATTYFKVFNVNRSAYNNTAKTSDAQKSSTKKALLNKDFRQALAFAWDRKAHFAQSAGEDAAERGLRNTLVAPGLVLAGEKDFGQLTTDKLVTYGDEWKDVNLADAQDGFYNADKAKAEFAKAKEALAADGVEFPIHLDMPVLATAELSVQQASSMKQSIEAALGTENVVIDILQLDEEVYTNLYYAEGAAQQDFDIASGGWGPDYQDPSTYLDVFDTRQGAMVEKLGLEKSADSAEVKALGFDKYNAMLDEANAEFANVATRYEKYAAAQAWLTDSAYVIPYQSLGGTPSVSKMKPGTATFSWVGIKDFSNGYFKAAEIGDKINVAEDTYAAREKWLEEKAKSNAEAQEDLANHIE